MNTHKRPAILGDIFDIMGTQGCLILVGRDYFGLRTESCLTVDHLWVKVYFGGSCRFFEPYTLDPKS